MEPSSGRNEPILEELLRSRKHRRRNSRDAIPDVFLRPGDRKFRELRTFLRAGIPRTLRNQEQDAAFRMGRYRNVLREVRPGDRYVGRNMEVPAERIPVRVVAELETLRFQEELRRSSVREEPRNRSPDQVAVRQCVANVAERLVRNDRPCREVRHFRGNRRWTMGGLNRP